MTNWFGHKSRCGLGKTALSRMVAVAALIWLSISASRPAESFCAPSRLQASTGSWSFCNCAITRGSSSCGRLKMTAIGSSCVITTTPLASEACTRLPGSTCRIPVTPSVGDLIEA